MWICQNKKKKIDRLTRFNNTQDSGVQANNFSLKNHVYCVLGYEGCCLWFFFLHSGTINSETNYKTLTKLCKAILNKRYVTTKVFLLFDSIRQHVANHSQNLIPLFDWKEFDHIL